MARPDLLVVGTIVLLTLVTRAPLRAQHDGPDGPQHLALLASNAMVGAAGAALVAWLRGEDASRAFYVGAVGGSISYAGKVTATTTVPGATIAGRQVAAVGHSIIANAAAGDAALSEIWLPFSPFRLRIPVGGAGWGVRLDLMDVATLAFSVLTPELRLDAGLSLRMGTPVFVARSHEMRVEGEYLSGMAASSVILLSGDLGRGDHRATVLAHEVVHVIQSDFAKVAISYPFERWAASVLMTESPTSGMIQGGFTASVLEFALAGARVEGKGLIRDLIETEASTLVRPVRKVFPGFEW